MNYVFINKYNEDEEHTCSLVYLFEAWSGSGVVFRGLDLGRRPFESFLSFEVVRGDTAGLHGGVGRSEKIEDPNK